MSSEPSTRGIGRPYSLTVPEEETSWALSHNSENQKSPGNVAYGQLDAAAIDLRLSTGQNTSENPKTDSQHLYSTDEPPLTESSEFLGSDNHRSGLVALASASRQLPSQIVSDETLDESYVSFIMFCNPAVPLNVDTLELRKVFRSPPKSDGKSFSTYTLFELIRKLEFKEIKTWAQLAIDLGVEPPAMDKGQSAQKVQQYAVRLKRWMHAMHIDAFFEYLLQKNHVYWNQIPSVDDQPSEFGRDGVIPEEDLALRALIPEIRPKRGRRKAEERDKDSDMGKSPSQKPRLHSPTLSEDFGIARGTPVDGMTPTMGRSEWSSSDARVSFMSHPTISLQPSQSQLWNQKEPNQTPFTPHPHSAIIPRSANPFLSYEGEPQSAITPSSSRPRRRHGPAVSSAWPNSGTFSAGKLRGRPPSNRSISDGPFSTFPANPSARAGPTLNLRDGNFAATPVVDNSEDRTSTSLFPNTATRSKPLGTKPNRLYLQVPQRIGGAVRLATPPPTLVMNGENQTSQQFNKIPSQEHDTAPIVDIFPQKNLDYHSNPPPGSNESTAPGKDSEFSTASIDMSFRDEIGEDRTNVSKVEYLFTHRIMRAQWFDHRGVPIDSCNPEEVDRMIQQVFRNLRDEATSKEAFLINLCALAGGEFMRASEHYLKITRLEPEDGATPYAVKWSLKFGAVEGTFDMRIDVPEKPLAKDDGFGSGDEESDSQDWKERYIALRSRIKKKDQESKELRKALFSVALTGFGV